MSLLSKANDSVDLVKSALDAKIALAAAEDKERLADAKLALADLKIYIAELKEENEILTAQIKTKDEVLFDDTGIAWIEDQPYCAGCLGSKNNKIRLKYYRGNAYQCPACTTSYGYSSEPKRPAPQKP